MQPQEAQKLDLVVLGVGAGATQTYVGEPSSAFMLRLDGQPLLMLDVGLGAVLSAHRRAGGLPQHIYVSHNHTDHAGELPVLLAVEAQAGRRKTLLAEGRVLRTLQEHRLAELRSTGQPLAHFADCQACAAGRPHLLPGGLAITPLHARHAERCCGLLVHWKGRPVLGWSGDSGYDAALYAALAAAPVVLLDGRAKGSSEHAGFSQLQAAASSGILGAARIHVYGYGTAADAPGSAAFPSLHAVRAGDVIALASSKGQEQQEPAPDDAAPVGAGGAPRRQDGLDAAAAGAGAAWGPEAHPRPAAASAAVAATR